MIKNYTSADCIPHINTILHPPTHMNTQHGRSFCKFFSECLPAVAPLLGGQWKQLARALPIERSTSRVDQRIKAIEARHPGDETKQAAMALAEWRINHKQDADVDKLISALRKCHMECLVSKVELITQEFTV